MEGKNNTDMNNPVLALYDIRGIQKYIFKTIAVKDAKGASGIIEDIIVRAMESAISSLKQQSDYADIKTETIWCDEKKGYLTYESNDNDIQILFSGGGNAAFIISSGYLCVEINKLMSKYVLENTYSLQLAVAFVNKTDNYSNDYINVNKKLVENKAKMINSSPLGTLPIMKMEIKTGYPIESEDGFSRETLIKKEFIKKQADNNKRIDGRFDSYITKKGMDSNLAVVHIDGNNMGQRIRTLVEGIPDYLEAVNRIREISFNINHGYKDVFDEMSDYYNVTGMVEEKANNNFVLRILVAGDDITYVCNAGIALDSVNYFCNAIAEKTLVNYDNKNDRVEFLKKYGFSVCAGIAFFTSHFPFYIAYEVAESCCDNAKKYAKANKIDGMVSNWLDYQICKNIQAIDVKGVREVEYVTSEKEILYRRPYYVSIEQYKDSSECYKVFEDNISYTHKIKDLEYAVQYFKDTEKIPRSISKEIRNLYSEGERVIDSYVGFLKSRNHKLPDDNYEMYIIEKAENNECAKKYAKWYDALEILDYYVPQFKYFESETISK